MSTAVTPTPEQGAPLSQIERVTNVFFAPTKTFSDIRRSANWLLPWVVMALFSLAFTTVVAKKVGFEQVSKNQMKLAPASRVAQIEALPPEQRAGAERNSVTVTKVISYGFSIFTLIWLAIVALVLWGTFSFGLGAEVSYGQSLAIVMFASVVGIVKTLLGIAVIMAGLDPESFMIQNPVGTNPGYYLSFADTPRFLYTVASSVDIIVIWTLILTGIGFACVSKVKRGTAIVVVLGWYALFTLCSAALGAAFS
ncbi:MAG: hypothetical protein JWO13_111 [Acidobacteriales bacterium]|nr:hypothetical protein [Terriglobales bacterium]